MSAQMECNAFCYSFSKGIRPVISQAVYENTEVLMSSINVKTERNHTIAFTGTSHGDLMKVRQTSCKSATFHLCKILVINRSMVVIT